MLVVFSPIFVAGTKIIFRYDFVAPLTNIQLILLLVSFELHLINSFAGDDVFHFIGSVNGDLANFQSGFR